MLTTKSWLYPIKSSWRGFTLIEVLIVMIVLWVGILIAVRQIGGNLQLVRNIHNNNTATLLAREGLELLYNYRDTNALMGYTRNCVRKPDPTQTLNNNECRETLTPPTNSNTTNPDTKQKMICLAVNGVDAQQVSLDIIECPLDWNNQRKTNNDLRSHFTNTSNQTHLSPQIPQNSSDTQVWLPDTNNAWTPHFVRYLVISNIAQSKDIPDNTIYHVDSVVLYSHHDQVRTVNLETFISDTSL